MFSKIGVIQKQPPKVSYKESRFLNFLQYSLENTCLKACSFINFSLWTTPIGVFPDNFSFSHFLATSYCF